MRIFPAILLAVMVSSTGCGRTGDPADPLAAMEPPFVLDTPLPVDPTDDIRVAGWWIGAGTMLRLDRTNAYALYDGTNRYRPPTQRGRWSQQNYASLRLEPYSRLREDPIRVSVRRIDERVALVIGDAAPMFRADRPPAVLEDRLLGRWTTAGWSLDLDETGRYVHAPTPAAGRGAAGHRGIWRLEGTVLVLSPDTPGLDDISLSIKVDGRTVTLHRSDAVYVRAG